MHMMIKLSSKWWNANKLRYKRFSTKITKNHGVARSRIQCMNHVEIKYLLNNGLSWAKQEILFTVFFLVDRNKCVFKATEGSQLLKVGYLEIKCKQKVEPKLCLFTYVSRANDNTNQWYLCWWWQLDFATRVRNTNSSKKNLLRIIFCMMFPAKNWLPVWSL